MNAAQTGLLILGFLALILAGVAVYLSRKLQQVKEENREGENRFHRLEEKVGKLELQSLESKLNPHLFKNILNSIQSHAFQTYHALDKLANVLDYILYESRGKFVTPKAEIEFSLNLIEINKIKISPLFQLKVKTKVNENEPLYHQQLLAPLISIDLIENAFKHADLQSQDAFISIVMEFRDNFYYLTVSNKMSSKKPIRKEKSGIGTETLEQRLKLIYKEDYRLERFVEGDVYTAHLKINLLEYKAKMLAAR
ncbi:MAG: histidine kinase [Crocinitomicaceae bacterium]|jgi:LytS/YehU family sensor histidine kinase|nr:histidine kinase [Crocinitomicaceae bacterium]